MVGQDPARFRRSTTATRFPCEASDQAKDLALPLPSTTTSYSSGSDTFFLLRVNSSSAFHALSIFANSAAGVGGLAVDVVRRAELPGERLLVLTPGDRGRAEPHPRRVLHPQLAEPAEGGGVIIPFGR